MYALCISFYVLVVCVGVCMICVFIYLSLWYVPGYVGSVYFFVCPCGMCRVCMLCIFLCLSLWYVSGYVGYVYLFICPCGMCQGI